MTAGIDNDNYYYVETTVNFASEEYTVRVTILQHQTALDPTRVIHLDYIRTSDSDSGRYENVTVERRNGSETSAKQALVRQLGNWVANNTPVASPVYG